MGIGISTFTEIVGAGPSNTFDILGIKMFDSAEIRVHPTGSAIVRIGVQTQGQGHETTFAQIVAEELGLAGREHHGRAWRHRHRALRPRHLRQPQHADRRRGHGDGRPQDPREGPAARRPPAGGQRGRPGVGRPQVPGEGRARAHRRRCGDRVRGLHQPSAGHGGRPGGGQLLRPAEPDLPLRRLHLRRRHRPRHRRGEDPPLPGHRRLRHDHQPDDRRGPDPRRSDDGHGAGAATRRSPTTSTATSTAAPSWTTWCRPRWRRRPGRPTRPSRPRRTTRFGAKGVGESATVGAPPAIANAVVDALSHLGVRHIDIPITPWKVYEILVEHGAAE